jgi:hypothetical protein
MAFFRIFPLISLPRLFYDDDVPLAEVVPLVRALAMTGILAAVCWPAAYAIGQSRRAVDLANGGGQADLVVEPSEVTFHLKPGGRSEQEITITNRGNKPTTSPNTKPAASV